MKEIDITHRDKFFQQTKKSTRLVVIMRNKQNKKKNLKKKRRKKREEKPVKLFKAETTGVVVVYLVNCMFENLPGPVGVFRIHHHPVLERLYLKIPLPLVTHLLYTPLPKI